MPTELTNFFYPKSIAIIGASRSPEKLGSIVVKNIKESGYSGKIFPINPNATDIQGFTAFVDVSAIPEVPELAIVCIPSTVVGDAVTKLGEKGVKNVVVLSAGFKEIGAEGEKLEKNLIDIAKKFSINLLGPNCLGFVNTQISLNATFAEKVQESGNLRFITQSGAIAASLVDYCNTTGLGVSEFVTLGNKAGITENDILFNFLRQSQDQLVTHLPEGLSNVRPIGLYLESIANGPELLRYISEISKKDPVLIIKPGKTTAAAKAMQSHTGAIAGEDAVLDEVLKQSGAIRCYTLEEFFDYSRAFAWENSPLGPKVAVISNAGGPAVISADSVVTSGLEFAQFDDATKTKLQNVLPRSASIINPVDVLGDALSDRFAEAIEIVLQNSEVDSLIVLLTPQLMTEAEKTAQVIGELSKKYAKPILCSFIGGRAVEQGTKALNKYKIPSFEFPERAIKALSAMWQFKKRQINNPEELAGTPFEITPETGVIRTIIQKTVTEGSTTVGNVDVDSIFKVVGINTPPTKNVVSIDEAKTFAAENGWPVVLKLSAPGLIHKDKVGGVILNIIDNVGLEKAWMDLLLNAEKLSTEIKKTISFQIQKDVMSGVEIIIGIKTDPTFGPLLLFGAGGHYADLIGDKNIHLLPVELTDAKKIVEGSKIYSLLKDKDGVAQYALEKLYDLIVRVGKMGELIPEATDIEINPVIVTKDNVWAVDGKIIIKESKKPAVGPKLKEATCTVHTVPATKFNYFEFETAEPFDFKAGQYVSVKVSDTAIRAYSIASKLGPNKYALLVDTRPGGPGSQFFDKIKVGEKMQFLGPFGVFVLHNDDGSDHKIFLATGSGISALRCMIETSLEEEHSTAAHTLYYGLTREEEIFWKDTFDNLKQKYPQFNYEYVLYEPSPAWTGPRGFNTDLVKQNFKDTMNCSAYLCGHPAMIKGATDLLKQTGCQESRIYSERFV